MPGPAPKPAAIRQRVNRKSGAAELMSADAPRKAPALANPDERTWHALTQAWWSNVWSSPMAGEYLDTDIDGLARLALLIDEFYKTLDPKLMTEIRLQEARFGLSPVDRSRLQWEVAKGEEASRKRKPSAQEQHTESRRRDPRDVLRVVS